MIASRGQAGAEVHFVERLSGALRQQRAPTRIGGETGRGEEPLPGGVGGWAPHTEPTHPTSSAMIGDGRQQTGAVPAALPVRVNPQRNDLAVAVDRREPGHR
jgi:hypothetical protein